MRKSAWAGVGFLLAGGTVWSQTYVISTVAGGGVPFTPAPGASVGLASPVGVAADVFGNVYFSSGNLVFKVDGSGNLTRVAGNGRAGYSGDSGPATAAELNLPQGVAVDGSGTLYIADTGNNLVRKVTADGVIATVAGKVVNGSPSAGYSGDGGPATAAQLNSPQGVAADGFGNLFISDSKNSVIREVAAGVIATVAGNGTSGFSGDGGPPTSAQLNNPAGIAVDAAGRLYIADSGNSAIRLVPIANSRVSVGNITTVAGVGGVPGYFGDGQRATIAQLNAPSGVAVDLAGNLYISDTGNNAIRKVGSDGTIETVAGNGIAGFKGDGGPAANAQLWSPWGLATDTTGDVFIADHYNYRLREIAADGTISTLAGNGADDYRGDGGPATSSQLVLPKAVAVDTSGNLYIADTFGNTVREVTPNGTIKTVAGTGLSGYAGDNGLATAALLKLPQGVVVDSSGNVYIADTGNQVVREVTIATGDIATFAGNGTLSYSGDGGAPTSAELASPCGLALDSAGNLYIADLANNVIREVSQAIIATVAGAYNAGYYGDGSVATSALLNSPTGEAVDAAGNLYIADSYNHVIRKVDSSGNISTVAGNNTAGYSGDGAAATSAQLFLPTGVAVDSSGNLFIADSGNNVIREVNVAAGTITTVGGNHAAGAGYSGDGGAATSAQLNGPTGVAVDSAGNVYVADANNNVIRLLSPASHAALGVTVTHSGFFQPGQTNATYTVTVGNATGAGTTSGTVTVTANLSTGLTLGSMSGAGWSCSGNACTRSDALAAGSNYATITVTVTVAAGAASPAGIQVAVSGGGSAGASGSDAAAILGMPSAPVAVAPANGVGGVSTAPVLSWGSSGATSYEVYFGTSPTPPLIETTAATSYSPGLLSGGTTYYWEIAAQNSLGTASSPVWSFTTGFSVGGLQFVPVTPCRVADTRAAAGPFGGPTLAGGSTRSFAIPQGVCGIPSTAQAYSLNVTAVPAGPLPYLTLWPTGLEQPVVSTLNSTDGSLAANAAIVPAGSGGAVSVFVAGQSDVILDIDGYFTAGGGSSFYTVTPCRVADTRLPAGPLGGPSILAGQSRDFPIRSGPCGFPAGADPGAYSLNVTAVPDLDFLGYLTTWATGQPQPLVSTLNSWTGTVVANAAIVPAGSNGSISVYVTDPADVILDLNGYFGQPGSEGALSFYPLAPCRAVDTRSGPILGAGTTNTFALPASGCHVPAAAAAYALNVTVVPQGALSYLTLWPAGSAQPLVSTLNALNGNVTANAAIVPAGTGGAISVYVTDPTHVIIDINGYFAP
ncbi:MAG: NHL repeat-containing protein [Bryobacteraceae bacterium]|jgi:hypothetical protein